MSTCLKFNHFCGSIKVLTYGDDENHDEDDYAAAG